MKILLIILLFCFIQSCKQDTSNPNPNFIIIYADDLGYGDVSAYELEN